MCLINFKYLVLASALVGMGIPIMVSAETDLGQLVIAGDISSQERLVKKAEITQDALALAVEKAEVVRTSLEKLTFEKESVEEGLRSQYLNEVSGYISFYQERGMTINTVSSLEEVDALIQTVIEYRESVYAPSAKNVLEFVLVFSYGPSVLDTAKERYESIRADVERLSGLNLIGAEQFTSILEQCQLALEDAEKLQIQAKELILQPYQTTPITEKLLTVPAEVTPAVLLENTTIEPEPTVVALSARELAEESLNKIKGLYGVFIETGQEVKETLGI
jgi:hypothetical protein